ncbi:DNA polymerase I [Actinotignum urinale]|uniref:DNA polymerase I n=1 Tax=Actinotignum urinale TaxID=190146 RepID=UPI000C80DEF2|nr:DNA polymerase I [Actinotignum urinale]WIK59004.1 DNA polymerase I [Actinotignum urinale]
MADSKILLIDGHSMAFRAFHSRKAESFVTAQGQYTNAIHGFLSTLVKVVDEYHPTHIAVAFDLPGGTFRTREYTEYKAGRKPTPEEFKGQIGVIQKILDTLGITWLTYEDYEADDIIATLSTRGKNNGFHVYIASGDKDAYQLVDDNVTLLYPMPRVGLVAYNPEGIKEKTGVLPEQYSDVAALVGEKADNIPGIPGVGAKTATKWITQYGSLAGLIEHADELKGKVGATFRSSIDIVKRNRQINQLVCDLPIGENLDDFAVKGTDVVELNSIFDVLEFKQMRGRVLTAFPKARKNSEDNTPGLWATQGMQGEASSEVDAQRLANTDGEKDSGLSQILEHPQNSDNESTSQVSSSAEKPFTLDPKRVTTGLASWLTTCDMHKPFGLTIQGEGTPGGGNVRYIAISQGSTVWCGDVTQQDSVTRHAIGEWLASSAPKIVHDAKTAWHACRGELWELNNVIVDTALYAYLLNPVAREYPLDTIVKRYLGVDINAEKDVEATPPGQLPITYSSDDSDESVFDKLAECCVTLEPLSECLKRNLREHGDDDGALIALEMHVEKVLEGMEATGIAIDEAYLQQLLKDFDFEVNRAENNAVEAIGRSVNLSSPKQLQEVLFDQLDLPKTRKTKRGYTTNVDALNDLLEKLTYLKDDKAEKGRVFLENLKQHRESIKLKQSVEGLLKALESQADNKIRTTFQQMVTATGRLSSTGPNLQNIHARTQEGLKIRAAFVPSLGYDWLMTADYSQIEMRIMASLSGDEALIEAFNQGEDLHKSVAALVLGKPFGEVTHDERSHIKAVSYGLAYGLSAFGLSKQLRIPQRHAQYLMDTYFERFGRVREYLQGLVSVARRDGYTETMGGRRRYLPELHSDNRALRESAERMALNAPIQGTAADIMKMSMCQVVDALAREGMRTRVLLQVHDELVLEVPDEEREVAQELVVTHMMNVAHLRVPLSVGVGFGKNWRDAAH